MPGENRGTEPDPRVVYADIIDLPHRQSTTRPHMSLEQRAAQFASYKALSGFEDMIAEEARETAVRTEPEEYELERLNRKLALLAESVAAGEHPLLTFTVFTPDPAKEGGSYADVTDRVKRVDTVQRRVILMTRDERSGRNRSLEFGRIAEIRGELLDNAEDVLS